MTAPQRSKIIKKKFTHEVISSKQRCYFAPLWPVHKATDPNYYKREQAHPLVVMESGQVDRVKGENLRYIGSL